MKTTIKKHPKPIKLNKQDTEALVSKMEEQLFQREPLPKPTRERLQQNEANLVVSMISDILENNEDKEVKTKLTKQEEKQLKEFLIDIERIGVHNMTRNEINSMRNYIMSITSHTQLNEDYFSESKKQIINEATDLVQYINNTLSKKANVLSQVQKSQLEHYSDHIKDVGVKNISENEVVSIQNHIRSAIYKEKKDIMSTIDDMMSSYALSTKKKILTELRKELKLLADEFLSKADSDYFTEQLKLLQTGKYIIREHLIDLVDEEFLNKIGKYPDSYIDKVNKLKTKIRRKPFILPHKYKDKIMNKLKQITRVNKFLIF